MLGKEHYYAVLLGMQIRAATLENSLDFSLKKKKTPRNRTSIYTTLLSHFFIDGFLIGHYSSLCTSLHFCIGWEKEAPVVPNSL